MKLMSIVVGFVLMGCLVAATAHDAPALPESPALIKVEFSVMDGGKVSLSGAVRALPGEAVPIFQGEEISYVSHVDVPQDGTQVVGVGKVAIGDFLQLTPESRSDGRINVRFLVRKSHLLSVNAFRNGDQTIHLPSIRAFELEQSVVLMDGRAIDIPFGPDVVSDSLHEPLRSRYTLRLTATQVI